MPCSQYGNELAGPGKKMLHHERRGGDDERGTVVVR
jgi:hypothetical protein